MKLRGIAMQPWNRDRAATLLPQKARTGARRVRRRSINRTCEVEVEECDVTAGGKPEAK